MGVETVVSTELGALRGRTFSVDGRTVNAFLGVRFGEPPVGERRFRAPVASSGWTGERDALEFGPAAMQGTGLGVTPNDVRPATVDEDCLFLNVWAPGGDGPRPVMVWIHGGGFSTGATSDPSYNGARLAAVGDVVVVSIAYRVGALGFAPVGDSNCGLRDQLLALDWVSDHIASFGGDPENVTVFGESAGGGSALHLLTSPHARFRRAIVQSGATAYTLTPTEVTTVLDAFTHALGGADPRSIDVDRVLTAQSDAVRVLVPILARMPFHPGVDGDIVPALPVESLRAGAAAGIDLIIGTTRDEMALFVDVPSMTADKMRRRVERYVGGDGQPDPAQLVDGYEALLGVDDPIAIWTAVYSDKEMLLPALAVAEAHTGSTRRYQFDWSVRARGDGLVLGACHGADIPFTFGSLDQLGWDHWTAADDDPVRAGALTKTLQAAWCAFARGGAPEGWPEHDAGDVLVLGPECGVTADPSAARAALWAQTE